MLLTATTVDLSEAEHWNSALFIIQWGAGSSSLASGKETFCIVTQQWMKCKCWGSPKGFHFACHALAVTELESVVWSVAPCVAVGTRLLKPNGCQMYEPGTRSTVTLPGPRCCSKEPPTTYSTHKLAPFNESHNCFKGKLHPFKPVWHINQKRAKKNVSTLNL